MRWPRPRARRRSRPPPPPSRPARARCAGPTRMPGVAAGSRILTSRRGASGSRRPRATSIRSRSTARTAPMRREEHDPEHADGDDEHRRRVVDAEPDDREGDPGEAGDRPQQPHDPGREAPPKRLNMPRDDAERRCRAGADREARRDSGRGSPARTRARSPTRPRSRKRGRQVARRRQEGRVDEPRRPAPSQSARKAARPGRGASGDRSRA